jgi:hypothetical protein
MLFINVHDLPLPKVERKSAASLLKYIAPFPMKLTPTQIEQFRRRGYVAVPGFFNATETAALQADITRLKRNGFLRNVATTGDGRPRPPPSRTSNFARQISTARSSARCPSPRRCSRRSRR